MGRVLCVAGVNALVGWSELRQNERSLIAPVGVVRC
jgi:hypothetical protein